ASCGKKQTQAQKKEQVFNAAALLYQEESGRYKTELAILTSGYTQKKAAKKLVNFAESNEYTRSFWASILVDRRMSPERIPLHMYIDILRKNVSKLKSKEKKLSKNIDYPGASELGAKIRKLMDRLDIIEFYITKSKDYLNEDRFIAVLSPRY
ncbi:MAG: hypothetical protein ABH827_05490, partial [bacterium]